ncbi:hypothetical protein BKA93DRAFT_752466 [Sparassis latifolia]
MNGAYIAKVLLKDATPSAPYSHMTFAPEPSCSDLYDPFKKPTSIQVHNLVAENTIAKEGFNLTFVLIVLLTSHPGRARFMACARAAQLYFGDVDYETVPPAMNVNLHRYCRGIRFLLTSPSVFMNESGRLLACCHQIYNGCLDALGSAPVIHHGDEYKNLHIEEELEDAVAEAFVPSLLVKCCKPQCPRVGNLHYFSGSATALVSRGTAATKENDTMPRTIRSRTNLLIHSNSGVCNACAAEFTFFVVRILTKYREDSGNSWSSLKYPTHRCTALTFREEGCTGEHDGGDGIHQYTGTSFHG